MSETAPPGDRRTVRLLMTSTAINLILAVALLVVLDGLFLRPSTGDATVAFGPASSRPLLTIDAARVRGHVSLEALTDVVRKAAPGTFLDRGTPRYDLAACLPAGQPGDFIIHGLARLIMLPGDRLRATLTFLVDELPRQGYEDVVRAYDLDGLATAISGTDPAEELAISIRVEQSTSSLVIEVRSGCLHAVPGPSASGIAVIGGAPGGPYRPR